MGRIDGMLLAARSTMETIKRYNDCFNIQNEISSSAMSTSIIHSWLLCNYKNPGLSSFIISKQQFKTYMFRAYAACRGSGLRD